jgi:hypothetical protein
MKYVEMCVDVVHVVHVTMRAPTVECVYVATVKFYDIPVPSTVL